MKCRPYIQGKHERSKVNMSTSASFIQKVNQKIRYGMVIHYLLAKLSQLGLIVNPYFLMKEFFIPTHDLRVNITPRMPSLTTDFLDTREIESILDYPERKGIVQSYKFHDRISDGCLCLGVKHELEIIAYTWCDLKQCNHKPLRFNLKKTEAYLFDMYIFKAYRGRNIAPYLRHQQYSHLKQRGLTDFFSIIDAFNKPSLQYHRKLGARPIKLYLYLKLGEFFERNFLLKSYE